MQAKYKVRLYLEVMYTIEVDGDIKAQVEDIAKDVIQSTNLHELVKNNHGEYMEDVIAVVVDTYDTNGTFLDKSDALDIDEVYGLKGGE